MTHTIEILGVGFVNVHPVLAVADAVEVPGCGEKSTETSRRYLRHLILVLRPLFPNMDLCVGFQLHVYTYTHLYNTSTQTNSSGLHLRSSQGFSCFVSDLLCQRYRDTKVTKLRLHSNEKLVAGSSERTKHSCF